MIINEKILRAYGAQLITLEKEEYLFIAQTYPQKYYQMETGTLKITSGKIGLTEFIHRISGSGDPVGETFLYSDSLYTVNAIALSQITVYALDRAAFNELVDKHPETIIKLYQHTCQDMNYQQALMNKTAFGDPQSRIIIVINQLKIRSKQLGRFQYELPYTRKRLASMTGLRTETVIKTLKLMEKENVVKIIDGKVFY